MARGISALLLLLALFFSGGALAEGLDDKGKADAKEATHLFNLGKYEEAAPIYARLALEYPDMVVFLRNLGACNYYLGKPEPALSALRRYLKLREDIKPEDRATVERWIDEMEKLRAARLMPQEPKEPTTSGATSDAEAQPDASAEPPAPPLAPGAPPVAEQTQPAGLQTDVAANTRPAVGRPLYKTWWFWTGTAAAVAAVVTTAILLSRDSAGPCEGRSSACIVTE
jgi:tetratricopeptide (TPR) repeat protein